VIGIDLRTLLRFISPKLLRLHLCKTLYYVNNFLALHFARKLLLVIFTNQLINMKTCKSCGKDLHPQRAQLGFSVCTSCSTEERWSGVPVVNHKTGNEIQIVKDPEVAADFLAKSARIGFGTLRGMSSSGRKSKTVIPREVKPIEKPVHSYELSRTSLPHEFEQVCQETLDRLDKDGLTQAIDHVKDSLEKKRIYGVHAKRLYLILQAFVSQDEWSTVTINDIDKL
jgi:hypothetical protein